MDPKKAEHIPGSPSSPEFVDYVSSNDQTPQKIGKKAGNNIKAVRSDVITPYTLPVASIRYEEGAPPSFVTNLEDDGVITSVESETDSTEGYKKEKKKATSNTPRRFRRRSWVVPKPDTSDTEPNYFSDYTKLKRKD
ncbi:hypothetical protein JTB14_025382 [Gonioctena quinquepunctata]|nr:hypothetical protein JTB14_025382 [Gonioctena quinquepunctata]